MGTRTLTRKEKDKEKEREKKKYTQGRRRNTSKKMEMVKHGFMYTMQMHHYSKCNYAHC